VLSSIGNHFNYQELSIYSGKQQFQCYIKLKKFKPAFRIAGFFEDMVPLERKMAGPIQGVIPSLSVKSPSIPL